MENFLKVALLKLSNGLTLAPKRFELVDQVALHFWGRVREQVVVDVGGPHHGHTLGCKSGKVDHGPGQLAELCNAVRGSVGLLVGRLDADDDAALAAFDQPAEGVCSRLCRVDDRAHAHEGSALRVLLDDLAPAEGGGGQLLFQGIRRCRNEAVGRIAPLEFGFGLNKK